MLILKVLDISAVDLVSVQLASYSNIHDMVVALLSYLPGTSQECYDDELSTYLLNASRGSTQGFIHPITIQRIILTEDFMKGNAKKYINKCRKIRRYTVVNNSIPRYNDILHRLQYEASTSRGTYMPGILS